MLDSLKRLCERLAAGHLDCESVMDTYAYAGVSRKSLSIGYVFCMLSCKRKDPSSVPNPQGFLYITSLRKILCTTLTIWRLGQVRLDINRSKRLRQAVKVVTSCLLKHSMREVVVVIGTCCLNDTSSQNSLFQEKRYKALALEIEWILTKWKHFLLNGTVKRCCLCIKYN